MNNLKLRKALVLIGYISIVFLGVYQVLAFMQGTYRITNTAMVKAVGVEIYKNVDLTVPITEINWGVVERGKSKNVSAYVVNRSNVPISLSMTTENWNPANASDFITLSWDYDQSEIAVDDYVFVTFVLTIDNAISGIEGFSFIIVVVGSG